MNGRSELGRSTSGDAPYDPAVARQVRDSERRILTLVHQAGSLPRSDITRATQLTQQTISRLVDDLAQRGLVTLGAATPRGRGKPSATIRLAPEAAHAVGVSVTTDTVDMLALDFTGTVVARASLRLPHMAPTPLAKAISGFIATLPPDRRATLAGVGVGMTGFFVGDGSQLNPPGEAMDDLALVDLEARLGGDLRLLVRVENDGAAAAVGESLQGVGRWTRSLAYIAFTAGVGGGIVVDGRLLRGAHGNGGEFAAILPLDLFEVPNLGRLQAAVAERGPAFDSLAAFLDAFRPDWPGVEAWLDAAAPALSLLVSAIHAVVDPEVIVLGGRLPPTLFGPMVERIALTNPPRRGRVRPPPIIRPSEVEADAVALGAASLILKEAYFV